MVYLVNNGSSYFTDRTLIKQGVPKGLILGPPLSLLYVKSLTSPLSTLTSRAYQFFDDTSVNVVKDNIKNIRETGAGINSKIAKWC